MTDFHQTGLLATFHRLGALNLERLESDLENFNRHRPLALVLPMTPNELDAPALHGILANIKDIPYLNEIVVTLGRTDDPAQFARAQKFFSVLPQRHRIVWASGPRFLKLYKLLEANDLSAGGDGKGRSAWGAYGYILSREESKVIGLHDCDIVNHSRELVGRLFYPVASLNIDYAFCKGYYARVTDRMHGRVTRLFVTPLIRSLIKLFGHLPFLVYLDSFRYTLSGEFSMITDLARINRIPSDWGLEVETLAEVYRNYSLRRVCQAEICDTYEHKHQPLSSEDPRSGLMKMAVDIAKSVFRNLAIESIILSDSALRTLVINYQRTAKDDVKRYRDDADFNGLAFDYHLETVMVEAFTQAIQIAGKEFLETPLYSPLIPSWNRVTSAIPGFLDMLRAAVEEDKQPGLFLLRIERDLDVSIRVEVGPGRVPDRCPRQERERIRDAHDPGRVLPGPVALHDLAQPPAVLPAVRLVITGLGQPDLVDLFFGGRFLPQPVDLLKNVADEFVDPSRIGAEVDLHPVLLARDPAIERLDADIIGPAQLFTQEFPQAGFEHLTGRPDRDAVRRRIPEWPGKDDSREALGRDALLDRFFHDTVRRRNAPIAPGLLAGSEGRLAR